MFSDHLNHTETYRPLGTIEAIAWKERISDHYKSWLKLYGKDLSKSDRKSLRTHFKNKKDAFG